MDYVNFVKVNIRHFNSLLSLALSLALADKQPINKLLIGLLASASDSDSEGTCNELKMSDTR